MAIAVNIRGHYVSLPNELNLAILNHASANYKLGKAPPRRNSAALSRLADNAERDLIDAIAEFVNAQLDQLT